MSTATMGWLHIYVDLVYLASAEDFDLNMNPPFFHKSGLFTCLHVTNLYLL